MLKIGWDLDGVGCLTNQTFLDLAHGQGLLLDKRLEDWSRWKVEEAFGDDPGAMQATQIFMQRDVYLQAEVCIWVAEAMDWVQIHQGENHVVTARYGGPTVETDTETWLKKRDLSWHTLAWVPAPEKRAYCAREGLLALVEDKLETANEVAQDIPVFLVAEPWNLPDPERGEYLHPGVVRGERTQLLAFVRTLHALSQSRLGKLGAWSQAGLHQAGLQGVGSGMPASRKVGDYVWNTKRKDRANS